MTATCLLRDRIEAFEAELLVCFDAGYEAEAHGSTMINCHFSLFSTLEKTNAWNAGRALAVKVRALYHVSIRTMMKDE
jgi:hypothetical protein